MHAVAPAVRAFYERMVDFDLFVKAVPHRVFAPVWKYVAKPFFAGVQHCEARTFKAFSLSFIVRAINIVPTNPE